MKPTDRTRSSSRRFSHSAILSWGLSAIIAFGFVELLLAQSSTLCIQSGPQRGPRCRDSRIGDNVYLVNGEYMREEIDLVIDAPGLPFVLTRTYRSKSGQHDRWAFFYTRDSFGNPTRDGLGNPHTPHTPRDFTFANLPPSNPVNRVGWNWDHSFDMYLQPTWTYHEVSGWRISGIVYHDGEGQAHGDIEATWLGGGGIVGGPQGSTGLFMVATRAEGRITLEAADGTRFHFFDFQPQYDDVTSEILPIGEVFSRCRAGRLVEITDRNGSKLVCDYGSEVLAEPCIEPDVLVDQSLLKLQSVTITATGQVVPFAYDAEGRLVSVSDTIADKYIKYVYFGTDDPNGNAGDLKAAQLRRISDDQLLSEWSYTYYKPASGDPTIFGTNLKQITDPNGVPIIENRYGARDRYPDFIDVVDWSTPFPDHYLYYDSLVTQFHGGEKYEDGVWTNRYRYDYVYPPVQFTLVQNEYVHTHRAFVFNAEGQAVFFRYNDFNQIIERRDYDGTLTPTALANRDTVLHPPGATPTGNGNVVPDLGQLMTQGVSTHSLQLYSYSIDHLYRSVVLSNGDEIEYRYLGTDSDPPVPDVDPRFRGNVIARIIKPGGTLDSELWQMEQWTYDEATPNGPTGCCGGASFPKEYIDSNSVKTTYDYDNGNLIRIRRGVTDDGQGGVDFLSESTYTYTSDGLLETITHPSNGTIARTDRYEYYAADAAPHLRRRLKSVIVDADTGGLQLTTQYEYNPTGQVSRAVDPMGGDVLFFYDERGLLSRREGPLVNFTSGAAVRYKEYFKYDAMGRLVRHDAEDYTASGAPAPNAVITTIHEYDALGRRVRTATEIGDPVVATTPAALQDLDVPADQLTCSPTQPGHFDMCADERFAVTEYKYDAAGNVVETLRPEAVFGRQPDNIVSKEYSDRGVLLQETVGLGAGAIMTRHLFDENGVLTSTVKGFGSSSPRATEYAYDAQGRLALTRLADGTLIQVGDGAEWSGSDPDFDNYQTGYDPNGGRNHETRYGNIPGHGFKCLSETMWLYDDLGRLSEIHRRVFDPVHGREPTDEWTVETRTYWPDGSVQTITNAIGQSTDYIYDRAGRQHKVILPSTGPSGERSETEYSYDSNGNAVAIIVRDARAAGGYEEFRIEMVYDEMNRLVARSEALGETTQNTEAWGYDARGNMVRHVAADGALTNSYFDGLGRAILTEIALWDFQTGEPVGPIVISQSWDLSGRLIARTDANGNTTRYAYDGADRMIMTRFADGTLERVGSGGVWASGERFPDLTAFSPGVSVHGERLIVTDANGSVVTTAFDSRGRPTTRSVQRGPTVIGTTSEEFQYDGLGRVWLAQDDDTLVTRSYDSLGRLLTETTNVDEAGLFPGSAAMTVQYEHDEAGNVERIDYPNGSILHYPRDPLGRLSTVTRTPLGGSMTPVASYSYDGADRVARRVNHINSTDTLFEYDGVYGQPPIVTGSRGFRQPGRVVTRRLDTNLSPIGTLEDRLVRRDERQRPVGLAVYFDEAHSDSNATPVFERNYTYDGAGRLVHSTRPLQGGSSALMSYYDMDRVHNRSQVSGQLAGGSQVGEYQMTSLSSSNLYTSTPWHLIQYDANGNLIRLDAQASGGVILDLSMGSGSGPMSVRDSAQIASAEGGDALDMTADGAVDDADGAVMIELAQMGWGMQSSGQTVPPIGSVRVASLRYDYRNQMVEYDDDEQFNAHVYRYDCFGRRLSRKVFTAGVAKEIRYIYAGASAFVGVSQLALEYHGSDVYAEYVNGRRIDEVLVVYRDPDSAHPYVLEPFVLHQDEMSNVTALTDDSGQAVDRYVYGDYGAPTLLGSNYEPVGSESSVGNTRKFQGREWDPESRLYLYRSRYLEPTLGRFTTWDGRSPWRDPLSLGNAVAFAASNPVSYSDPYGMAATRFMGADAASIGFSISLNLDALTILRRFRLFSRLPEQILIPGFNNYNASLSAGIYWGFQFIGNCRSKEVAAVMQYGGIAQGSIGQPSHSVGGALGASVGLELSLYWNAPTMEKIVSNSWFKGGGTSVGIGFPVGNPSPTGFWWQTQYFDSPSSGAFGFTGSAGVGTTRGAVAWAVGSYGMTSPNLQDETVMSDRLFSRLCTSCSAYASNSPSAGQSIYDELRAWARVKMVQMSDDVLHNADQPSDAYVWAWFMELADVF